MRRPRYILISVLEGPIGSLFRRLWFSLPAFNDFLISPLNCNHHKDYLPDRLTVRISSAFLLQRSVLRRLLSLETNASTIRTETDCNSNVRISRSRDGQTSERHRVERGCMDQSRAIRGGRRRSGARRLQAGRRGFQYRRREKNGGHHKAEWKWVSTFVLRWLASSPLSTYIQK